MPDLKAACPEYTEGYSQVVQDVLLRMERTFQGFFRRVKAGETPGYPRFQGKDRYHAFTDPQYGNGAVLDGSLLSLSKIGRIPLRLHRPLEGAPKTVTISQEVDGWYASCSCAEVPTQPLPLAGRETGIDVGLKVFLVTAEGETVATPRHYRKAEKALAKAQKRVSKRKKGSTRRKKGSTRRKKAVKLLAKKYQKVRRQRQDFHHKAALALLRANDTIYLEDLRVAHMVRNHRLAKSISDAGWAAFRTLLEAKAAYAGRQVVAIPPKHTTQDCSNVRPDGAICGERVSKTLSVRTHICPRCGYVADRGENAARNRQWAGQALRGLAGLPAGTNREAPCL